MVMTCSDSPCRARLSVLCLHRDTAVSAGVASAAVTHTVGKDGNMGADKMCARTAGGLHSYMETWPSAFG